MESQEPGWPSYLKQQQQSEWKNNDFSRRWTWGNKGHWFLRDRNQRMRALLLSQSYFLEESPGHSLGRQTEVAFRETKAAGLCRIKHWGEKDSLAREPRRPAQGPSQVLSRTLIRAQGWFTTQRWRNKTIWDVRGNGEQHTASWE